MGFHVKSIQKNLSKVVDKTFDQIDDKLLSESYKERLKKKRKGKIASRAAAKKTVKRYGLSPIPEVEEKIKKALNERIIAEVKGRKITHEVLAMGTRTGRPCITRVINRNLKEASIEFLLRILCALGVESQITFKN